MPDGHTNKHAPLCDRSAFRYSLLAGFLEVGETLEQAVGREVLEESGVTVDKES